MNKFKLVVKIFITAMFALIILYAPIFLMILTAKYVLGVTQINDMPFLVEILIMLGISFVFFWWFDSKFKIHKIVSCVVDKIWKSKL
jgi:hypothetical protein